MHGATIRFINKNLFISFVSLFGTQFFLFCACDRARLNRCLCLVVLSDTYCTVVKTSWISLFYRVIGNVLYNISRLNKYLSFVVLSDIQLLFVQHDKIQYIYCKIFGCSHVRTLQHNNSLLKMTYKMTS